MQLKKVLLLGKFGPAFLAFSRVCCANNIKVYLLEIVDKKVKKNWRKYSSCLSGGEIVLSKIIGTDEGIDVVKKYACLIGVEAIVALSDAHLLWLSKNKKFFEPAIKLFIPDYSSLFIMQSKIKQVNLAKEIGFDVLDTYVFSSIKDCMKISENIFPLCIRPSEGNFFLKNTFKAKVFYNSNKLLSFLEEWDFSSTPIIAQPFLNVPNVVIHGARSLSGEILEIKAFLALRKFEGFALSLIEVEIPKKLKEMCANFVGKVNLFGSFHYDFLFAENKKKYYFLEINPRLGGTTDKVLRMGFNEPELLLKSFCYLNKRVNYQKTELSCKKVVNKKALLKQMVFLLKNKFSFLDYPQKNKILTFLSSLSDLCFARDSVFNWADLRGTLWFYFRI